MTPRHTRKSSQELMAYLLRNRSIEVLEHSVRQVFRSKALPVRLHLNHRTVDLVHTHVSANRYLTANPKGDLLFMNILVSEYEGVDLITDNKGRLEYI